MSLHQRWLAGEKEQIGDAVSRLQHSGQKCIDDVPIHPSGAMKLGPCSRLLLRKASYRVRAAMIYERTALL